MYETIERLTTVSISRGVGFAALAIVCFMVGFASNPVNVLKSGGIGSLVVSLCLYLKAINATPLHYKRTEVWIMLDEHERPPADIAAVLVTKARKLVLFRWVERSAWVAVILLSAAVLLLLIDKTGT